MGHCSAAQLCSFSGCVYEDMKYSWKHRPQSCVSTLDSSVFAFTEPRSRGLGLTGREKGAIGEKREETRDDEGSKRKRKWG